jgi:hypothetical protein
VEGFMSSKSKLYISEQDNFVAVARYALDRI